MNKALSKLLINALGLALLVYSGMRSLDFVTATLPADKQILAYFALAATEGGILVWLQYYLNAASGGMQRAISVIMLIVDFLGSVALFTADTLLRSGEVGMTTTLAPDEIRTVILAMAGVIALNVAATLGCHIVNPKTRKRMASEEAQDAIEDAAVKRITDEADNLAAELAPSLANDWKAATRARYTASLGSGQHPLLAAPDDQGIDLKGALATLQGMLGSKGGENGRLYASDTVEAGAPPKEDPQGEM